MCGGGVRSILLLLLVARCIETIDSVYGTCLFKVCCSDLRGYVGMGDVCCVAAVVEDNVFSLGVLKYVV